MSGETFISDKTSLTDPTEMLPNEFPSALASLLLPLLLPLLLRLLLPLPVFPDPIGEFCEVRQEKGST